MARHITELFFIAALSLVSTTAFAKPVCPSAKDIMASNSPDGHFAKTIWNLDRARFDQRVLHNSVLIFSEETIEPEVIHLKGYFWWRRRGKMRDCSEVQGTYRIETRELELLIVATVSKDMPINTQFTATLSATGDTLTGNMKGRVNDLEDRRDMNWQGVFGHHYESSIPLAGNWKATKIYPVQSDDSSDTH